MRKEIKKAMACYTGGNQYIYYGQFEDGQYFFASDDSYCIELLKYEYDIDEHFTDDDTNGYIDDALLWLDILDWITLFAPNGNYSMYELEERIKECKQHIRYGCKQEII